MEGGPREDMGRRWAPTSQGEWPQKRPSVPTSHPWLQPPGPRTQRLLFKPQAVVLCPVAERKEGVSLNLGSGVGW